MGEAETNQADAAVKWLLETLACGFIAEAIAAFFRPQYTVMVISGVTGLLLAALGFGWAKMRPTLHKRLVSTATYVATDFRWWLAVLGVLFLYLGSPPIIDALNHILLRLCLV
jgi:hypothetical protein